MLLNTIILLGMSVAAPPPQFFSVPTGAVLTGPYRNLYCEGAQNWDTDCSFLQDRFGNVVPWAAREGRPHIGSSAITQVPFPREMFGARQVRMDAVYGTINTGWDNMWVGSKGAMIMMPKFFQEAEPAFVLEGFGETGESGFIDAANGGGFDSLIDAYPNTTVHHNVGLQLQANCTDPIGSSFSCVSWINADPANLEFVLDVAEAALGVPEIANISNTTVTLESLVELRARGLVSVTAMTFTDIWAPAQVGNAWWTTQITLEVTLPNGRTGLALDFQTARLADYPVGSFTEVVGFSKRSRTTNSTDWNKIKIEEVVGGACQAGTGTTLVTCDRLLFGSHYIVGVEGGAIPVTGNWNNGDITGFNPGPSWSMGGYGILFLPSNFYSPCGSSASCYLYSEPSEGPHTTVFDSTLTRLWGAAPSPFISPNEATGEANSYQVFVTPGTTSGGQLNAIPYPQ